MSSTLYHTEGIVLSWHHHREVDRRYHVYTKDHGKVVFLARGGHKPLAKLTPHLEAVCELDLLLVIGRGMQTVAGVERKRSFPGLYSDLARQTLAQSSLHLVDIGTREHEEDARLYDLLQQWLGFLEGDAPLTQERAGYLLGGFTLKFMALIGYAPELRFCVSCQGDLSQVPKIYWHALRGGVVCDGCVRRDQAQWFSARLVTPELVKLLRFASKESLEHQLRIHLSGEILSSFHEAIESLLVCHFPTIPASSLREACLV